MKKIGKFLSSMGFAVTLLVLLAAACALCSLVEQGLPPEMYEARYGKQAASVLMALQRVVYRPDGFPVPEPDAVQHSALFLLPEAVESGTGSGQPDGFGQRPGRNGDGAAGEGFFRDGHAAAGTLPAEGR